METLHYIWPDSAIDTTVCGKPVDSKVSWVRLCFKDLEKEVEERSKTKQCMACQECLTEPKAAVIQLKYEDLGEAG